MAGWPVVGRFVRIGVAVIRLPEFRAEYLALNHRQHVFENEQLPALLRTIADLSRPQPGRDDDKENLVKSVPVALRKITRELIELRARMEHDRASVGQLAERVEFVRREWMFEMRYGGKGALSGTEGTEAESVIVNPEKLAAARGGRLRLNLGCGHLPLAEYLNIDRRALPGVDIVSGVHDLPFAQGEVDEIFSAHLLEHFPQEQLRRQLLPYWVSLLKPGATLGAVVPDAESMMKGYAEGSYPYASLREVTFGGQDYDGDFHFNMFVTDQLEALLQEAGLHRVEWRARGRKNGACHEMEFRAVKK